jgi:PIN domain nuclease of toxin-antitoxin system
MQPSALYTRQLIEDRTNERLLSIASLWEMAIINQERKYFN